MKRTGAGKHRKSLAARVLCGLLLSVYLAGGCGISIGHAEAPTENGPQMNGTIDVKTLAGKSSAWGDQTTSGGVFATAWGKLAQAIGDYSTAFGVNTTANTKGATAWGFETKSGAAQINGMSYSGDYTTAWGVESYAIENGATAWGGYAKYNETHKGGIALGLGSTAFGSGTSAAGILSTAWGSGSSATGEEATAWGYMTQAQSAHATAWGSNTEANGPVATAWGFNTLASGAGATAWGKNTAARGEEAAAWGESSTASAQSATAFGDSSSAEAFNSLAALGGIAETNAANSAAIGSKAKVTVADTVALGSGSVASRGKGDTGAYLKDSNTGSAWVATHNAIAVGNDEAATRQITGVAAGSKDTDAVNVAQLKAAVSGIPAITAGSGISTDGGKIAVNADSADFTFDSDGKLQLKKDGAIAENNQGIVTGDAVYQAILGKADKATTLAGYGITDGATKEELAAATQNLTDVTTRVSTNETSITAFSERMDTMEASVKALSEAQAGYGTTDGAIKTELTAVTTRVSTNETNITAFSEKMETLEASVKALAEAQAGYGTSEGAAKTELAAVTTRVSANETNIKALSGRMNSLESTVKALTDRMDSLESTVKAQTDRMDSLESSMKALMEIVNQGPVAYTDESSPNQNHQLQEGSLVFTFKRNTDDRKTFSLFDKAMVDNRVLTMNADYTIASGSLILTLKPAFLDALSVGEHTLTVLFADGKAESRFTVSRAAEPKELPKTGDTAHPALWISMIVIGAAALCGAAVLGKRRKKNAAK